MPLKQVLPNLTSRVRSRVEDLQRKLAERDESRHGSVIGRAENTTTSKLDVKVLNEVTLIFS